MDAESINENGQSMEKVLNKFELQWMFLVFGMCTYMRIEDYPNGRPPLEKNVIGSASPDSEILTFDQWFSHDCAYKEKRVCVSK